MLRTYNARQNFDMIECKRYDITPKWRNRTGMADVIRKERLYGHMKRDAFNRTEWMALL